MGGNSFLFLQNPGRIKFTYNGLPDKFPNYYTDQLVVPRIYQLQFHTEG